MKKLENKMKTIIDKNKYGPWAIVTGASSGIGKEFARQLASAGLNLVLVARRGALLEELSQNLSREFKIQCKVIALDLSKDGFVSDIDTAVKGLDIGLLVSMQGAGKAGAFLKISHAELREVLSINLISHLELVHYFAPTLVNRGRGGIVMVGAMGASLGVPYIANIAATKAYVESFGEALHIELKEHNVNVFTLLPGPTNTDLIVKEFGMEIDSMPMKPMSVDQCVAEGLKALQANQSSHIPGRLNRVMRKFMHTSPVRKLMTKMQRKSAIRLHRI
ncbi:MAG: SDR family NAD(P)-dependent oxidoreductase [Gammaproteobacteria bacterium]|nr:SDR family NAD(P)-dependent oxidoreductase [Gammaproteobacteria bacterium]